MNSEFQKEQFSQSHRSLWVQPKSNGEKSRKEERIKKDEKKKKTPGAWSVVQQGR